MVLKRTIRRADFILFITTITIKLSSRLLAKKYYFEVTRWNCVNVHISETRQRTHICSPFRNQELFDLWFFMFLKINKSVRIELNNSWAKPALFTASNPSAYNIFLARLAWASSGESVTGSLHHHEPWQQLAKDLPELHSNKLIFTSILYTTLKIGQLLMSNSLRHVLRRKVLMVWRLTLFLEKKFFLQKFENKNKFGKRMQTVLDVLWLNGCL